MQVHTTAAAVAAASLSSDKNKKKTKLSRILICFNRRKRRQFALVEETSSSITNRWRLVHARRLWGFTASKGRSRNPCPFRYKQLNSWLAPVSVVSSTWFLSTSMPLLQDSRERIYLLMRFLRLQGKRRNKTFSAKRRKEREMFACVVSEEMISLIVVLVVLTVFMSVVVQWSIVRARIMVLSFLAFSRRAQAQWQLQTLQTLQTRQSDDETQLDFEPSHSLIQWCTTIVQVQRPLRASSAQRTLVPEQKEQNDRRLRGSFVCRKLRHWHTENKRDAKALIYWHIDNSWRPTDRLWWWNMEEMQQTHLIETTTLRPADLGQDEKL